MKSKYFLTGLLIAIGLLWPLTRAPYFSHHDDVQVIRLYEMDKCVKDLQIPCRWVPDLGGLYGYPLFNYYAPLPYYIGEVFYLISHSLTLSAKLMFALSFLGSYLFMFLLGRKLWGNTGGALSGIFYSLAPYHAVVFYVRGAMGEMWALMLYPAILWAVYRLFEQVKISNVLLLALFTSLLILSHNLSTMIFLPIILIFIAFLYLQKRDRRFLKFSAAGLILSLMLAAFYLLPMVAEKNLVHVDSTVGGYFSYTEHFKGLRKLFLEYSWGWGASVREVPGGEKDGMSFQIGWVHLLGWFLAIIGAQKLWKKHRSVSLLILLSSTITLLSIYMINPRSLWLWDMIEPLKYLQFPWRFLMIIIFFVSLLSGSIFLWIQKRERLIFVCLVLLVIAVNFSYFRPEKFIKVTDQDLLSGNNWDRQIKRSIFDFLPIYAKEPPAELAITRHEVIFGDTEINNFRQGTNWFSFNADTRSHTIVRVSQYYFPEWKIWVNGKETNFAYADNSLGLMTLILGPGQYHVEGRLEDTPVRTIANGITSLGVLAFVGLILTQIPRTRRWIFYYLKGMYR